MSANVSVPSLAVLQGQMAVLQANIRLCSVLVDELAAELNRFEETEHLKEQLKQRMTATETNFKAAENACQDGDAIYAAVYAAVMAMRIISYKGLAQF